ncbi:energy transducer TonB [Amphiplicatus metriothermophilus]|uniref:Outer membrane transport energization protein TonB n=1 Tax=Amphiplicatus metriothermophilus TaxID=1519374 RepID=A0A239PJ35_9PROT|nr:energy transducer TonB [Amphiplicatus metriothermophilus]MBB5518031.1 hypothetical protein [Amphiplicatus metriothermophilus]SNT67635.1 outer membrane transport energization protein TonB [Amphiplicatus metriothermophilus]
MSIMRWIFGAPAAIAITAALFVLMAGLIRQDLRLEPAKAVPDISIVAKIPEPEIGPEGGKEELSPPEAPPPIPPRTKKGDKPEGTIDLPKPGEIDPGPIGPIGGPATAPTIRVAPAYPERCAAQNVEGVVLVQFDVTPERDVVNPLILSSSIPASTTRLFAPFRAGNIRRPMRTGVRSRAAASSNGSSLS